MILLNQCLLSKLHLSHFYFSPSSAACYKVPASRLRILIQICHKLLHILHRHGIVIARPNPAHGTMSLQAYEVPLLSSGQEGLLGRLVASAHPEADVHAATHALVRDDGINVGRCVEGGVEDGRFGGADGFLAGYALGGKGGDEVAHDLGGDPEVEDGQSVVEGVVFGHCGVVEHDGAGEAGERELVEQGCRRCEGCRREERFANNHDRDAGYADVLLGAALEWAG